MRRSEYKISVFKYRHALTVLGDTCDAHICRADHEVHMVDGVIATLCLQILLGEKLTALDRVGIAITERQMAGCIFIKQRIVEKDIEIANGGVISNQCNLTETARALVGFKQTRERFLTACRVMLNDSTTLKAQREVFDQTALIGKRHRGNDRAFCLHTVGHRKDLLCGHVREVVDAVLGALTAAKPNVIFGKPDLEIGADAVFVFQCDKREIIELLCAALEHSVVLQPFLDRVTACDAYRLKNRLPELLYRLCIGVKREDLLCPRNAGVSNDGPAQLTCVDLIVVFLESLFWSNFTPSFF